MQRIPLFDFTDPQISPLIISTDYSSFGLSAILSQIQFVKEVLISCTARKTTPAEQSYSSIKGELKAIIYALQKFETFINFSNFFFIITDSLCLKWLINIKSSSKLLMRWSTYIFSFPFKILHRKGKIHIYSDTLSREQSVMSQPTEDDIAEGTLSKLFSPKMCKTNSCKTCNINKPFYPTEKDQTQSLKNVSIFQLQALSTQVDGIICPFLKEQLVEEQRADRVLLDVYSWMTNGLPEEDFFHDQELKYVASHFEQIFMNNDILYIKFRQENKFNTLWGNKNKILAPLTMREEIIKSYHNNKSTDTTKKLQHFIELQQYSIGEE